MTGFKDLLRADKTQHSILAEEALQKLESMALEGVRRHLSEEVPVQVMCAGY